MQSQSEVKFSALPVCEKCRMPIAQDLVQDFIIEEGKPMHIVFYYIACAPEDAAT